MEPEEWKRLERKAEQLKALGHPMRLAMLERLKSEPWCVCELAANLGLNKSTASKHLSQLHEVGLLSVEKRGTQVIYTLIDANLLGKGVLSAPGSTRSGAPAE